MSKLKLIVSAILAMVFAGALAIPAQAKEWPTRMPNGDPVITIYHMEGRRSERIVWFCEEIGLPYKLMFKRGDMAASSKMAHDVNPLMAMFPTVVYNGQVMVESGAILQLLQERYAHGKLAPAKDSPDYPKYLQWLHFAEGSAAPRFITEFLLLHAITGEPTPLVKSQLGRTDQVLKYLEDYLSGHPYFGGSEFSIADIMMDFEINFESMVAKHDMTPYPHVMAWFNTVHQRPAFIRMRQISLPDGFIGVPK
jgi:glutathione S-transferase